MNSLAEVVVAGFLLTLAFTAMLGPLEQGHRSAQQTQLRLSALALAHDLTEQLRSQPFDKLQSGQGCVGTYSYALDITSQPYLRTVAVTVRWGHNGRLQFGTCIQGKTP